MMDQRRHTTQAIAWFLDLYKRDLLDLKPSYQRRSVWNQSYADYFIDTVLLNYPAPAIFLYEDISETGSAKYSVVDGRQRLTTVLNFIDEQFPVGDKATKQSLRGKYFSQLPAEVKKDFFRYQFAIEYLPSTDEGTLSNIFDRINRNVARLTPQELRHARFSGVFATKAEDLSEFMTVQLGDNFPRINAQSRRQMKDVELTVNLMLFIERGANSYSQDELEKAYSDRDDEWDDANRVDAEFRQAIGTLREWRDDLLQGDGAKYRNQADFYSLFAIVVELHREGIVPPKTEAVDRLKHFMGTVHNEDARSAIGDSARYYEAARSASSDQGPRQTRIDILRRLLKGQLNVGES